MELSEVARELLRVAPADFVAERTARQRAARAVDRVLATAIGGLRKPAPAAWIVNLLAEGDALAEAVDLGPTLREAQARADPSEIQTLRRQRAQLVDALAASGADAADAAGHPATSAVIAQVRATIEAAMADPHAAAAVRSGLLVRPLDSAGFDDVDLDGALAVPDAVPDAWSGSGADPIPITAGRRGTRPTRTARPSSGRAADRSEQQPSRAEQQAAQVRERQVARDAAHADESLAREASRVADRALDDAEAAAAESDDRLADVDDRLRALERERLEVAAASERFAAARDAAERVSDDARDAFAAARRRRRETR